MGEAQAIFPMLDTILSTYPQLRLCVTCSSPASALIQSRYPQLQHVYLPFDMGVAMRRFVKRLRPTLCILVEKELWPNMLHYLQQNNCRIALVNARLSEASLHLISALLGFRVNG